MLSRLPRRPRPDRESLQATDFVELALERKVFQCVDRQINEKRNTSIKLGIGFKKSFSLFVIAAMYRCWIVNSPVRRHRLARPYRASFCSGLITYGKYKIH